MMFVCYTTVYVRKKLGESRECSKGNLKETKMAWTYWI